MAKVSLSHEAERALARLPRTYRMAVNTAIGSLADEPLSGKQLRGRLRGLRSKRVGAYRILYRFESRGAIVMVVAVRHRGEAYR